MGYGPAGTHWEPIPGLTGKGAQLGHYVPDAPAPIAPSQAPPPSLPPAPSPIDPQQLAATLYDKKIPAILSDLIEVGGRMIEGPIESVIGNEQCVSFIAAYYIPMNYWDNTRTVIELYFRGTLAWTLSGGALLSGLYVGGATTGTEQRVRFVTGQLNQAPDAWSVAKFGVDDANGYPPLVLGIFENIRKAQFGGVDPFTSITVQDTAFGSPGNGIRWDDALAAVARYDGRGSDVFETTDVSGRTLGIILGDSLYFPDFLSGMRKLRPQWSILTDRKLRVVEKGVFNLDQTIDIASVLAHDDAPIVFHGTDAFDKPRKMIAHFVDIDRDYEPNQVEAYEDSSPVQVTDSFNIDEFNVPLVSTSSEMIAEVNFAYYSGEMARESSEFTGMAAYYNLEPGDLLKIPTDERDYFHRNTEIVRKVDFTIDVKGEGFLTCAIATPGFTWIERLSAGTGDWDGCAISADGQIMVVVDQSGNALWMSTNGGALFTHITSAGVFEFVSVGMSSDGQVIAASVIDTGSGEHGVRYSNDGGSTWSSTDILLIPSITWIAVSGDGSLIAVQDSTNGNIYISTDFGASFSPSTVTGQWTSISISRDGTTIVGTTNEGPPGKVWVSNDAGATWNDRTPSGGHWFGSSVSSDGSKIAVASNATGVWYSTDSGVTFNLLSSTSTFSAGITSMSDDGTKMIVANDDLGNMGRSTDSGATWLTQDPPGADSWSFIASSADGDTAIAVVNGSGSVWTGTFV